MTAKSSVDPTVIDEAYMDQFTIDQLIYKAWIGVDLVQDVLCSEEPCEDAMSDAKFEACYAVMALRVLVRRLVGMDPDALRAAVMERHIDVYVLGDETEQLPAWETLQ